MHSKARRLVNWFGRCSFTRYAPSNGWSTTKTWWVVVVQLVHCVRILRRQPFRNSMEKSLCVLHRVSIGEQVSWEFFNVFVWNVGSSHWSICYREEGAAARWLPNGKRQWTGWIFYRLRSACVNWTDPPMQGWVWFDGLDRVRRSYLADVPPIHSTLCVTSIQMVSTGLNPIHPLLKSSP